MHRAAGAATLRVSVTDRCNLRCAYCMPEEGVPLLPRGEIPALSELASVVAARVLGLLVLSLFAAVGVCVPQALTRQHPVLFWVVGAAAAGMLLGTWLLFLTPGTLVAAARWAAQVEDAPGFLFTCKLLSDITHKGSDKAAAPFRAAIEPLRASMP